MKVKTGHATYSHFVPHAMPFPKLFLDAIASHALVMSVSQSVSQSDNFLSTILVSSSLSEIHEIHEIHDIYMTMT